MNIYNFNLLILGKGIQWEKRECTVQHHLSVLFAERGLVLRASRRSTSWWWPNRFACRRRCRLSGWSTGYPPKKTSSGVLTEPSWSAGLRIHKVDAEIVRWMPMLVWASTFWVTTSLPVTISPHKIIAGTYYFTHVGFRSWEIGFNFLLK